MIARATNDIFWDWDLETNAAWRSEGASKTFGYPPDELISDIDFWIQRIHPEDRSRVQESIQAAINGGKDFWREEYRFRCKDEAYAEVLDRGYVVHNAKGKPVRMVGALSDISRQQEMETKLAAERNLLRALIDNYPDSVYVKDLQARKTLANKANVRNMGFNSEAEVLGKTDFELFTPEVATKLFADDQKVLKGESLLEHEERLVTATGTVYWMLTTKVPWRDAAGNIIGIIGGGRNITRQKEAELKLTDERNLLRTVIENVPDCIYAKDARDAQDHGQHRRLKQPGLQERGRGAGQNRF